MRNKAHFLFLFETLRAIGLGSAVLVGLYIYLGWWHFAIPQAIVGLLAITVAYRIVKAQARV